MKTIWIKIAAASLAVILPGCDRGPVVPEKLGYEIVSVAPHDPQAYTQGLQMIDGKLFESTGQYGQSSVRHVEVGNGKVLRKRNLPVEVFGEGLTVHGKEVWVLTWKEKTAYVLEPENFRTLRTCAYEGEGWGLTSDGRQLIMSDGGNTLKFRDSKDMAISRSQNVTDQGRTLKNLNELEYVKGAVFANVYLTDRIARIDPANGAVTGWLDLSALRDRLPAPNRAEALNGIACDPATGNLWVTGKYWPQIFEIKIRKP